MKTEYQARHPGDKGHGSWTDDLNFLKESFRADRLQLWRRETESPEEAAVRQINWLEKANLAGNVFIPDRVSVIQQIDKCCPPPQATETQVDWDTGEPIKEVPVWQIGGVWLAGQIIEYADKCSSWALWTLCTQGKLAIGSTRENALRNLAELQSIKR